MHLTFDGNLIDATGRGNNGTNEASGGARGLRTSNYVPGEYWRGFYLSTTVSGSSTSANYVSLGVRPDLQFGTNISFTVSMWVQLPANYVGNDLPFFTDAIRLHVWLPGLLFRANLRLSARRGGDPDGWPGGWAFRSLIAARQRRRRLWRVVRSTTATGIV